MHCCWSAPTTRGLLSRVVAHCVAVADATELPVMLYDVPARTGIAMEAPTLIELAGHPRIRAVKDAKGDLFEAMSIMGRTSLAYYCGIDELTCPTSPAAPLAWSASWATSPPTATRSSSEPSAPATSTPRGRIQRSLIPLGGRHHAHMPRSPSWPRPLWPSSGSSRTRQCAFPLLEPPLRHRQRLADALATIAVAV